MALVNLDTALKRTITSLLNLLPGTGTEILSFKRDRGVSVVRMNDGGFRVEERGYVNQELHLPADKLAKALKTIFKREFPRSRKVRVYNISDHGDLERTHKKL